MGAPAIRVEGLWKQYEIGGIEPRPETFREMLTHLARAPLRRLQASASNGPPARSFWALRDVTFEVHLGEVLGIIGRNGAGKTTLLKILSRITSPTRGRIEVRGRLASLLEVGMGFHPELTGRENIYVNGAILGMRRAEINRKFDQIVAFAEVEEFLDTPVKRYSSGMAVRLAFAVAAHMDPDILVVDEVLAVGDAQFQKRCLGKLGDVSKEGRTVLFVSHDLSAILRLCGKGLLLSQGQMCAYGSVEEAIRTYSKEVSGPTGFARNDFVGSLGDRVRFTQLSINGERPEEFIQVAPSEPIRICVWGEASTHVHGYRTSVFILKDGQRVITRHDALEPGLLQPGRFQSEVTLPAYFLSPGEYWVSFGGYTVKHGEWTWAANPLRFSVVPEWSKQYDTGNMGMVNLPDTGRRIHHG